MSEPTPPAPIQWENSTIIRRGFPVDIQNEDRFSPMGGFAYSPLAQDLMSIDNGVLALILLKLARDRPAALERLAEKFMDNITDLLSDIVQSGKTSPIASINASTTFAVVAHRFGIITDSGYLKMADQTRSIIDKLIQLDAGSIAGSGMLAGLQTFVGGSQGRRGIDAFKTVKALKP